MNKIVYHKTLKKAGYVVAASIGENNSPSTRGFLNNDALDRVFMEELVEKIPSRYHVMYKVEFYGGSRANCAAKFLIPINNSYEIEKKENTRCKSIW